MPREIYGQHEPYILLIVFTLVLTDLDFGLYMNENEGGSQSKPSKQTKHGVQTIYKTKQNINILRKRVRLTSLHMHLDDRN